MSDSDPRPGAYSSRPEERNEEPTAQTQRRPDASVDEQGKDEGQKVADLIETLSKDAADYKDRLLRTLAEMENLRRRTDREIADSRAYGISNFARDILAVADNMDRALAALDSELRAKADAPTKALLDGVELTERELHKVLEKHGVTKFEPLGEKFDPNLHQAMYEVPDPARPAGSVAQVVQPGYMIGDRVLRPALVGVAKGGPKFPSDAPAQNDNAEPQRTN
jgi:molecular chaperone GrpE